MAHFSFKDYVSPVRDCGKSFGHGSSLTNHKYGSHFDIYTPPASWIKTHGMPKGMKTSTDECKKKKKK